MVSPSPVPRAPAPTGNRGCARQPPGRAAFSADPAACFCNPEHFAGGFEGGRRPLVPRPRPPTLRPLGSPPPPPPRLLQKGARTHRGAPGKAPGARLQDRQRSSAARRRLPRCFRRARPRGRSSARVRPSTCPSPRAGRRATREPLLGFAGFPKLAPAAPPPPGERPSRMEVTETGGWQRALCPPAGMRGPPPRVPDYKSAPLPISSLADSASSSEARRLLLAQDSSGKPSRIASRVLGHCSFFWGGGAECDVPPG
ncbi:unnamed protein product [Rangifer tarandus platyrhynchus]|uniref:Basic proline-rich protein-like n=2 Tax=Rangifer tarandus platyrhynchus TaxID=3082113 RepID=A0ABN8YML7_RANTA|nr:unnamed protein product [Rangifer tarandus platyrhynchus]CAI9701332.1 unnamed protein product [Rangifer tarandus platyrhynchus]